MNLTQSFRQDIRLNSLALLANCPDPAMKEVIKLVESAGRSRSAIILGETGVGKEIAARAIHESGPRKKNRFVIVNCGNQNRDIMGSEIFGHEKGAFTGAHDRHIGLLEMADGGTLFFDEIGELPLSLQARLLRVLEEYSFTRVGGTSEIRSDFYTICATNRDLGAMVAEKAFREDLCFRLNVFPIPIPPLRERPMDIPYFGRYFTRKFSEGRTSLSEEAKQCLLEHKWLGNVREMRNIIERAVILANGHSVILPEHLPFCVNSQKAVSLPLKNSEENSISAEKEEFVPLPVPKKETEMEEPASFLSGGVKKESDLKGYVPAVLYLKNWVPEIKKDLPILAVRLAAFAYETSLDLVLGGDTSRQAVCAKRAAAILLSEELKMGRKEIAETLRCNLPFTGRVLKKRKEMPPDDMWVFDMANIRNHFRKTVLGRTS